MKHVLLGEVAEINVLPERPSPDEQVTFVGMAQLDVATASTDSCDIRPFKSVNSGYTIFKNNDLLLAKITPCWENGKIGIAQLPTAYGVGSTEFHVVRPSEKMDSRFLLHYLKQQQIRDIGEMRMTGSAGQRRVPAAFLKTLELPCPSLEEQRRIAAILDHADALLMRRKAACTKLNLVRKSIFEEMFPTGSFEQATIGEVTECLDAQRAPVAAELRPAGDVPYYGANSQQGWIDRPLFNEPLVLVAEDGGRFDEPERGVAYKISGPSWVNNHAHVLRPGPRVNVDYLHQALRHYDFTSLITGSTRSKLNQKQLKSAPIMIPPLRLQHNFTERIRLLDGLNAQIGNSDSSFEKLIGELRVQAFNGKLNEISRMQEYPNDRID